GWEEWIWVPLVLVFPFLGFAINGIWGRRLPRLLVGSIGCLSIFCSLIASAYLLSLMIGLPPKFRAVEVHLFPWLTAGPVQIPVTLLMDPLSLTMALTVTSVSLLIHLYSIGYMGEDPEFSRYFALLNLFVFFMLTLVMAGNLAVLFIGWEGVGFCSFALISFWYSREAAAEAGKKAFIVTRTGDLFFLLSVLALLALFGTISFGDLSQILYRNEPITSLAGVKEPAREVLTQPTDLFGLDLVTVLCLGLFAGAVGKSAQFPLYVWLPDAMEGPTPVSALIHAATMVTAGVYMVARLHFLFALSPVAMTVVAGIGALTAFYSALLACVENDIKRVLAYSTISQLGYMFLACGAGAASAGLYHLVTHAYFKALLFLCAGSVLHATGNVLDIRRLGGLGVKMKTTASTFWIGALALSGLVPAGLISKDFILGYASDSGFYPFALATAFLTAFYTTRLGLKVFHGAPKDAEVFHHAHESPSVMTIPMGLLTAGTILTSFLWLPPIIVPFEPLPLFLEPSVGPVVHLDHKKELAVTIQALAFAGGGLLLGLLAYRWKPGLLWSLTVRLPWLYQLLARKFFVDEIYLSLTARPARRVAELVSQTFDLGFVDAMVNGVGAVTVAFGKACRLVQTGAVRTYALTILMGGALVLIFLILRGGSAP
ncbi:MAG: NADH-quinone oxidoreductase subunit L, partial [Armatimonadetes bacterium]|nr:NADH-quinone oxidoreductase subunit L [Armatimonadota bacterium]